MMTPRSLLGEVVWKHPELWKTTLSSAELGQLLHSWPMGEILIEKKIWKLNYDRIVDGVYKVWLAPMDK